MHQHEPPKKRKTAVIAAACCLLAVYFAATALYFPQFYLSLEQRYPNPEVSSVKISNTKVILGQSFEITLVGTNTGITSDMQTLSVSFPNMTDAGEIKIVNENFTQQPLVVIKGQEIGSHYQGTQYPVYAQYPLVEAYNRPWDAGTSHAITLGVTPETAGRFVIFVKSVVLPNSDTVHFPVGGALDQQDEFAVPYVVNVTTVK